MIERVPYGEPTTWCHRMVVTRKHDGSPRRTVDLSPLNKFCKRETFASESPFHLARRVPHDTWKTVTDAWNGYHSVPLRETDRHLTTFITPFGRWRYTRAPQGFLSSGDGYNRRFDAILSEVQRKERCVDDTIHYDTDLEEHWWRTIDLLTRVGQADKLLNPDKFQFSQKKVDFAGFRISESTIEPLPKYLDAIREFPTPTSTTDVRSWFGLVNQVANYAKLRDIMAPFQALPQPSVPVLMDADIGRGIRIIETGDRQCHPPRCRDIRHYKTHMPATRVVAPWRGLLSVTEALQLPVTNPRLLPGWLASDPGRIPFTVICGGTLRRYQGRGLSRRLVLRTNQVFYPGL